MSTVRVILKVSSHGDHWHWEVKQRGWRGWLSVPARGTEPTEADAWAVAKMEASLHMPPGVRLP